MPHWLQLTVAIVAGVASFAGAVASLWKFVLRPLGTAYRDLIRLLEQIRNASGGVQRLAGELGKLAGAFVTYAFSNQERLEEHETRLGEILGRIGDMGELLAELDTDVGHLRKEIRNAAHRSES